MHAQLIIAKSWFGATRRLDRILAPVESVAVLHNGGHVAYVTLSGLVNSIRLGPRLLNHAGQVLLDYPPTQFDPVDPFVPIEAVWQLPPLPLLPGQYTFELVTGPGLLRVRLAERGIRVQP